MASERRIPSSNACSIRGARSRHNARVSHTTSAWIRDSVHTFNSMRGFTSPPTAAITIPASTAFGSAESTPAKGRNTRTARPVIAPDQRVPAPER